MMSLENSSDGDLLKQFLATGREPPFAELVRRHSAMVLGACRRITSDEQDAEDAAQAVFLTLAKKAGSLDNRSSVGGWLYHVACHVALRSRRAKGLRQTREQEAMMHAKTSVEAKDYKEEEVKRWLDGELDALPEKYRVPVVLHHLEERPQAEVAKLLGLTVTAVASRLNRAREMLAGRLTRRGVALSAAGLVTVLSAKTVSAAPETFVAATSKAAVTMAGGKGAAGGGAVSANVTALVQGALKTMLLKQIAVVAALVLAVGGISTTGGILIVHLGSDAEAHSKMIKLKKADAREIFQVVAKQRGCDLIIHKTVKGTITGEFDPGSSEIFKKLAEAVGCRVYEANGCCLVYGKDWSLPDSVKTEMNALPKPADRKDAAHDGGAAKKILVFHDADLREVLETLAKQTDLKLVIPKGLKGNVTARFAAVSELVVLKLSLGVNECSWNEHDGVLEILIPEPSKDSVSSGGVSRELVSKAESSDADAQYTLGKTYEATRTAEGSAAAAVWFGKAAEQGHSGAQISLAWMYINGDGVPKNDGEGFRLLRKAAEQGDPTAFVGLGMCYKDGYGVTKDDAEAFRWFLKAAEKNLVGAQYRLALCYQAGRGVEKDDAKAVEYWRKAAEQNLPVAQVVLGRRYAEGRGVNQDFSEAVRWFRQVAEEDDRLGQDLLGMMYFEGKGVPQDYVEAFYWVSLANRTIRDEDKQEGWARDFVKHMAQVTAKLNPEQIVECKRRVADFKPSRKRFQTE